MHLLIKEMKEIKVLNITGNQINGRSIVSSLFVEKADKYVLDFTDVFFISRSASHELLTTIDNLKDRDVEVKLTNLSLSVKRMIKRVDVSRKSGEKLATLVNRLSFKSSTELDNFILSI